MLEGGRPKGGVYGFRPAVCGVKQSCSSLGGDILDAIFGAPVLMMGVDAAEGKRLIGRGNGGPEGGSVEKAVVGMVMADSHAVFRAKAFKSLLGGDSSVLVELGHEVDVRKVGEVVDEDSGACVASGGGGTTVSGNKTGCGADQLVNTDNLSGKGGRFDGAHIAYSLGSPGFPVRFSVSAAGAERRGDVGKFVRDHVCACEELES